MHDATPQYGQGALESRLLLQRRSFASFLRRQVGDPELAEDILQEAFSKALEREQDLRDPEASVAWFYRVLRNAVIDHRRRKGAEERRLDRFAQALASESEPDAELLAEACKCVHALMEGLKPEYSTTLRQVELEGRPLPEVAERAGITANNASVRLHRARKLT